MMGPLRLFSDKDENLDMKIELVTVGKLARSPYRELIQDYATRSQAFCGLIQHEVRPAGGSGSPDQRMKTEAAKIQKILDERPHALSIVLDERGDRLTSEGLSTWFQELMNRSTKGCVFVIGGAFGLTPEMKRCAHRRISLSAMTLPHELAHLVLVEQIYRAHTILRGQPYHKR
jgi:23S rRNA (pseudouridine1915-N3)-methyltransferase